MTNHGLLKAAIAALSVSSLGLSGCGYQTGPAGQPPQGFGVGYGTWGSERTPPPAASSGLLVPDSQLSGIRQTGTGAIGPGQGVGAPVQASRLPVASDTGSAQTITTGPAQRIRTLSP
jgi:hypothetical protein